ncbi:MAG: hypothetical protein ACI97A_003751 [Planctomycetota bacterium]|jgi:hypothetical protein
MNANCPEGEFSLSIFSKDDRKLVEKVAHVFADEEPLLLIINENKLGKVFGKLVGKESELESVRVGIRGIGFDRMVIDAKTGEFSFTGVFPGPYRLVADPLGPHFYSIQEFEVLPGQTVDLGSIAYPPKDYDMNRSR